MDETNSGLCSKKNWEIYVEFLDSIIRVLVSQPDTLAVHYKMRCPLLLEQGF